MREIFLPIDWIQGFEGLYTVSNKGRIWSKRARKILSPGLVKGTGYLAVWLYANGKRKRLTVHRCVAHAFLANPHRSLDVDHINGCRTFNFASNLRFATRSQNSLNSRVNSTSGYRGVSWHNARNQWRARVWVEGGLVHLGYFQDKETAALIWDAARYFSLSEDDRPFVKLNFHHDWDCRDAAEEEFDPDQGTDDEEFDPDEDEDLGITVIDHIDADPAPSPPAFGQAQTAGVPGGSIELV